MISAIKVDIITDNQTVIDAVTGAVPSVVDARVWPDEYQGVTTYVDHLDGKSHTIAMFRCSLEADQADITQSIVQVVMDNIAVVDAGSTIKLHKCYHDEVPVRGCEETTIYEVA